MTTPATAIAAKGKYTTDADIKRQVAECNTTQIDYFSCKIFDFIDKNLQTPADKIYWDRALYETIFTNTCTNMHELGADVEFSIMPTLRTDKYYTGGGATPSVVCQTTIRSYFNDNVGYKTQVARSVLENINNRFVARGHVPAPVLFASGTTTGPFNIYGISVPYPAAANASETTVKK